MTDNDRLVELNRNYIRSVQESDVRWFEEQLSGDFLNSNPDGSLVDRAGFLAQVAPPCPVSGLAAETAVLEKAAARAQARKRFILG